MSCNYRELQPAVHGSLAAESAWRDESMACDKPLDVSELFRAFGELLSFGGESAFPNQLHANGDDDLCSPSRCCGISRYAYAVHAVRRDRGAN